MKDFVRAGAGAPEIRVGDVRHNCAEILRLAEQAAAGGVKLLVTPELSLTGSTCGDLFRQEILLSEALKGLSELVKKTAKLGMILVAGLPVEKNNSLYDCAAVLCSGKILAVVPRSGGNADRNFSVWTGGNSEIRIEGETVPFGNCFLFENAKNPTFAFGVAVGCKALSGGIEAISAAGAKLVAMPVSEGEYAGRAEKRCSLFEASSRSQLCALVCAEAGNGESTTDEVFSGRHLIAEAGELLEEGFPFEPGYIASDVDLGYLAYLRRSSKFPSAEDFETVRFELEDKAAETEGKLLRPIPALPFVPSDPGELEIRCDEILEIQSRGLLGRIRHTNSKSLVLGISGGLDSALALLVSARTLDLAGRSRHEIEAISMPCFGTTSRTKNNAKKLCEALGSTYREINIKKTVTSHFADIGHSAEEKNVVYENAQARERTQVLMDVANALGGLVVGTGDLSELALGFATYNGDHMSMYGVNAGIPKTLIRRIVRHCAENWGNAELKAVLLDILDTPVSPELLPAENGKISQITEDLVGPYELHDFFLFEMLQRGSRPEKIFRLAKQAFPETPGETVKKWLKIFLRRFFAQQFKRSCLPDGPRALELSLSPRGAFSMPSDASSELWLAEADRL